MPNTHEKLDAAICEALPSFGAAGTSPSSLGETCLLHIRPSGQSLAAFYELVGRRCRALAKAGKIVTIRKGMYSALATEVEARRRKALDQADAQRLRDRRDVVEQAKKREADEEARRVAIVALARDQVQADSDPLIEVDDDAHVSESEDNGCYVQAWVWIDFESTPLDKQTVKVTPP